MRKPMIAGNWKMFKTRDEALQFIYAVNMEVPNKEFIDTVICAQAPVLRDLVKRQGEHLRIGAQNMHESVEGAFTGEISASLLENIGVDYVIVGHSERRLYFNETDEAVNLKLHQALRYGITPILCVGEALDTREAGTTNAYVKDQVVKALKGLGKSQVKDLVIAYEPIWAIGTGKTATNEQANETIAYIRSVVEELYNKDTSDELRILYGGSVKPENIDGLMAEPHIDGALVGGASLNPKAYLTLVNAAYKK
ncbi:triose-phosphate isomerase [Liberiplasma polymorphum]|uniref:triose-phosphate isomerase n=1 Tax=Liberiplasma polymorphum TaxID=3374570 RepID=UPI003772779A